MQTSLILPGSQQLARLATAVAAADGTATFKFERPQAGAWWSGSLNCAGAPVGAVFSALIDATPWGTWGGPTVFGPVQAQAGQQLTAAASGLNPGQQYALAWLGSSDPAETVQPIAPDANASALVATTQGSVDLLGKGQVALTAGIPAFLPSMVSNFTALHAYSSLIVFLVNGTNTDCPVIFVGAYNTHAGQQIAYESQASPMEVRPAISSPTPEVNFVLPFASAPGDQIAVAVTSPENLATVEWIIFGITAPLAVQVTNPLGNPLGTSERGGVTKAQQAVNATTIVGLLSAPAAGTVYRLHSFGVIQTSGAAPTGPLILQGAVSAFLFAASSASELTIPLNGLISTEGLNVNNPTAQNCAAYLAYDTIPTPAIS